MVYESLNGSLLMNIYLLNLLNEMKRVIRLRGSVNKLLASRFRELLFHEKQL